MRLASLDDVLQRIGNGAHTIVGERGLKLSGGEKQRVSIARAVLKKPKILLCDEATASLDTQTERNVMSMLETAFEDTTMLVIAHRLSTIRDADKIIVLHNGKVEEEGTHYELLCQGGLYEKLWNAQIAPQEEGEGGETKEQTKKEIEEK